MSSRASAPTCSGACSPCTSTRCSPPEPGRSSPHRILWTFAFCLLLLMIRRDWSWIRPLLRRPLLLGGIAVAAVLIAVNWVLYVAAVVSGNVSEAALGYFLNPIVTVALGVVVLRERLRPLQWVAVAIGLVAALYLSLGAGRVPWIALALAGSLRALRAAEEAARRDAARTARPGRRDDGPHPGRRRAGDLARRHRYPDLHHRRPRAHGAARAVRRRHRGAAAAVRRIGPTGAAGDDRPAPVRHAGACSCCAAWCCSGERMSTQRWVGFGIVWIALVVLTIDSLVGVRQRRLRDAADDGLCEPAPDARQPTASRNGSRSKMMRIQTISTCTATGCWARSTTPRTPSRTPCSPPGAGSVGSGPRRRSGPGSTASRPTPASTTAGRPAVARRPLRCRRRPHHLPTARTL